MLDLQFYPTPENLAHRAYKKFKNKSVSRLLEPSAGTGSLLKPFEKYQADKIDCIEIDFEKQAILRGKKFKVIDADFMQFEGGALYSHILMNPPFSVGAEHVIKAFNLLFNGELVAIINAETIKNPHTKQRQHLCSLIEQYSLSDVEFIQEAFLDQDSQKKTNVEIALIHLGRHENIQQNFTIGLDAEQSSDIDYTDKQELALKGSTIHNAVLAFDTAVKALRAAEIAKEEYFHYATLLGKPLNQLLSGSSMPLNDESISKRFNDAYDDLKNRAWTNILNSTEFGKYLSSKAYKKLEANFDEVKALSFTESNIRGFLIGLINGQSEMNMEMMLDTFDTITKYIPENKAYYRGWKSNLKHKEQAFRVQMTRFIIPRAKSYCSISWDTKRKLQDFDKTFAMLDGKAKCDVSLFDLVENHERSLEKGERLSSDYFDLRYYKGIGTLHFYPTNKKLIDRLNRLVGKERQWLPEDDKDANKDFWDQFEKAESITRAMVVKKPSWGEPSDDDIAEAHLAACEKMGINVSNLLEAA